MHHRRFEPSSARPARRRGAVPLFLLTLLLAAFVATLSSPAQAATENSGNPGQVRFVKRMDSSFNRYVENTTSAQRTWLNQKFWRMEVFTSYFDGMTSWYPKGWVYSDALAIYPSADDVARRGQWILKDTEGRRLYIDYDCTATGCSQYAADITNPAFRADWIASLKGAFARGNYRGAWVDDVNMSQTLARSADDRNVTAYSPTLGRAITDQDWRRAMATFMEEIRAAIPADKEILHNSPWTFGRDTAGAGTYYREVDRQIKAADYINREFGIAADGGLNSATQLRSLFSYIDLVQSHGKGVVLDDTAGPVKDYALAAYYLISTGRDAVSDGVGAAGMNPDTWSTVWETNLGQPKGKRFRWNGMLRRDFTGGMVLLKEPGAATGTAVGLGTTMTNLSGQSVTSVQLAGKEGLVLKGAPPAVATPAAPTISAMSPTTWLPWTSVTITGTRLKDAEVTADGRPVDVSANTETQISAMLPDLGYAGPAEVKVTTPGGSATTTFTYMPWDPATVAPAVSGISPASGAYNQETQVRLTGTNLAGATVTVDDRPVPVSELSATGLTVVVPPGAQAGTAKIRVRTAGGNAAINFAQRGPAPQISGLSRISFGTTVLAIIEGSGFTGATSVRFGSRTSSTIIVNDDEQMIAVEPQPAEPGGTVVDLRVTTPAGTSTTSSATRWKYITVPQITSVERFAFGSTVIARIRGKGFSGATAVRFGTRPAGTIMVNDDSEVLAVQPQPAEPAGTVVDLRVTAPGGTNPLVPEGRWTYLP